MIEEIKPRTLRALACDIEDCHNPQSWADYCRAAAAMLETQTARIAELEAALQRIASAGGLFAEPASGQHAREIARAALKGGKDGPA